MVAIKAIKPTWGQGQGLVYWRGSKRSKLERSQSSLLLISEARNFCCRNFATFTASNFIYAQAIPVESEAP
jgi:hypothetical protein